jgi:23S rRNA (uracil1939-C5)-methyltransferase
MHIDEGEQSRARVEIVCEVLRRIGGLAELPPIEHVPSPRAFGYRARARVGHEGGRVGFRGRGSRELVDVECCAVLDPGAQRVLAALHANPPPGRGESEISSYGRELRVGRQVYRIGPGAFFQANAALWERWREIVVGACGEGDLAVELYAGVGFYTACLEEKFERVIAIERGRAARWARENTRARVVNAAAEDWAASEFARLQPEVVLLNPPRAGCHKSVLDAVRECGASRVVYVSCEPSTLARDLARCVGELRLTRLAVMDSLPQTHHVEIVSVLERVDSRGVGHLDSAFGGE